jgi:ParB family transcriptional regulator, chromosome partitioning protein
VSIMRFFMAEIAAIDASDRLRPINPERVEALAASIAEIGLQQPILVRARPDGGNLLLLVAGGHRLEAARRLGWTGIQAFYLDVDAARARIIEIDENLIRNELSALDFAISVAERKRIYEALHPGTAWGKAPKPKSGEKGKELNLSSFPSFAKDAAKRTGLSVATFKAASAMVQRLSPEAIAFLRATPLADNGAALKKLSRIDRPEDQVAVARSLASGEAKSLGAALQQHGLLPAPEAVEERHALDAKFQEMISRSSATQRRQWMIMLLQSAKSGEMPALVNGFADHLGLRVRLKLRDALSATLQGYEPEPSDEEAV